jgi:glycosyltransferase involved in cell wall biosynthesis
MLEESVLKQLDEIKAADILVGLPSYNDARTIGHVVRAVAIGIGKYFPGTKAVLFNSDGGSTDGTREELAKVRIENLAAVLTSHPASPIQKIAVPYHGVPGKESALRSFFEVAGLLGVKACAVVDSDLRSITPEWMELLLRPVYEGRFDYVAPLYARHKFDGTITNSIVYPMTRSLYGKRVHQLIGGDCAFSGGLAKFYLTKEIWETDIARFGIDIWMTTLAIAEGYRICESYLGARIHDPHDQGSNLGRMFFQVVSSVFTLMEDYAGVWKSFKGSQPVPTFGFPGEAGVEPISINVGRMLGIFRQGVRDLMGIWRRVLNSETAQWLETIGRLPEDQFSFPQELWARIVYEFAAAYHKGSIHREHLLKSMIPIYLGGVASFVKENQERSAKEVEERIESLCMTFEDLKTYLLERWE